MRGNEKRRTEKGGSVDDRYEGKFEFLYGKGYGN